MSVYVKGMEMPTGNDELRLIIHPNGQVIISHKTYYEETEAVFVPPHGRLGDLDELERDFREDAKDPWNMRAMPMNWADAFEDAADIVADAPTIIPAEETIKEATNDQNNS